MSGRIAVIYTGSLLPIVNLFAEAASHVATEVRTLELSNSEATRDARQSQADISLLKWADGIAFGTPASSEQPAPELMDYLRDSERLWRSGRLHDKVVTVLTDQPQEMAPDSILHPIYDVLYRWGAVIVGPRDFELPVPSAGLSKHTSVSPQERAIRYRAYRLSRLTSVIAEDRIRRESLQL